MVWAAFNRNGPEPLHIVEAIMDSTSYRTTFYHMLEVKGWVEIGYSNRITIQNKQRYETLVPSEENHQNAVSPDLNPIEHLWNDVEKEVQRQKPSTIKTLEAVIKKDWSNVTLCHDAVLQLSRISGILRSINCVLTYCYRCFYFHRFIQCSRCLKYMAAPKMG
uniref:DDE_3 domain-containing protein n=1 Tax=Heterorhabditis bacteriophora TaxID=37862 RepID=A0A1I7WAA0_HETBA